MQATQTTAATTTAAADSRSQLFDNCEREGVHTNAGLISKLTIAVPCPQMCTMQPRLRG